MLESGIGQRKVASTSMNDRSSRSHSVLTCTLERTSVRPDGTHSLCQSRFNLVDLAGVCVCTRVRALVLLLGGWQG